MATFKSLQAGSASHLRMTGDVAGAISGGLTVASVIVRVVHDLVRDAISDVIGKIASRRHCSNLLHGAGASARNDGGIRDDIRPVDRRL